MVHGLRIALPRDPMEQAFVLLMMEIELISEMYWFFKNWDNEQSLEDVMSRLRDRLM
jgi:hypothetical protein